MNHSNAITPVKRSAIRVAILEALNNEEAGISHHLASDRFPSIERCHQINDELKQLNGPSCKVSRHQRQPIYDALDSLAGDGLINKRRNRQGYLYFITDKGKKYLEEATQGLSTEVDVKETRFMATLPTSWVDSRITSTSLILPEGVVSQDAKGRWQATVETAPNGNGNGKKGRH